MTCVTCHVTTTIGETEAHEVWCALVKQLQKDLKDVCEKYDVLRKDHDELRKHHNELARNSQDAISAHVRYR